MSANKCAKCGHLQVFVELTPPDFSLPWQRQPSSAATASGVMVRGPPPLPLECSSPRRIASRFASMLRQPCLHLLSLWLATCRCTARMGRTGSLQMPTLSTTQQMLACRSNEGLAG